MNLKQAAQRLAVHYQTAYRWVRDGELVAVKVGNRYEISESAIEQFVNRRASLISNPIDQPEVATESLSNVSDPITELRVLADGTRVTAQPCFDAATVLAGTRTGDAAVLRLVDDSGHKLRPVSSFAAAPEVRASVAGAVEAAGSLPRTAPPWSIAEQSGEVHIVHHMPQDLIRELFGEEGRFAGHGVHVVAAAVAPMFVEDNFVGGLLAVKTKSHLPFSEREIGVLREAAELCGHAHHRAAAFGLTWQSNTMLKDRVVSWLASGFTANDLSTDGSQLLDADRAQALMSPQGSVLISTTRFAITARSIETQTEGFAGRWQAARVGEVIDGTAAQVDIDPLDPADSRAIVSAARRPNAELQFLIVDVMTY